MTYAVVDTNVLVVASGGADHADASCRVSAGRALLDVQRRNSLVLDEGREILGEYGRQFRGGTGQPGTGELFFRWAASSGHRYVRLDRHPERGFQEFPDDPRLGSFDPDDRKFVAATVAFGTDGTELINAVDRDYSEHAAALAEAGVVVREVCPHHLD